MPPLDADVSYALIKEALLVHRGSDLRTVLNLSSTCRVLRAAALPFLFSDVFWPHANKFDEDSGLHFFPQNLWPFFRLVPIYLYLCTPNTHVVSSLSAL